MITAKKRILTALIIATTLLLFNVIAVTSGLADDFYQQIEHIISGELPL